MASRWVRYWILHGKLAAGLVLLGWSLLALADTGATQRDNAVEVITLLAGGGILTFGLVAGVTKWVVDPAVLRGLAKHRDELNAHASYVTRLEWDQKHTELERKIDTVQATILTAISNLEPKRGRGGHD